MEREMKKRSILTAGIIGLFLMAMACAGPSRLEMDFGTSGKLSKFNQILDPQAGKNLDPVEGLDGGAAKAATEKYRKEFEKPAPPTTYSLSVGSIGKK